MNIPTEVFEEIAQQLDTKDLLNISYVSRFCNDQANRVIYRSVSISRVGIPGHEYTKIKQFIRTIRSSPILALYVQELKFVAPPTAQPLKNITPSSVFGLLKWTPTGKHCFFSPLINVRKLSIETLERLPWPEYLNSFPAGKLEELTTYFAVTPCFLGFLALHPTIQRIHFPFRLASSNVSVGSSIPYNIAKSITHPTGDMCILPLVSTWTNLTHLGLAILGDSLPDSTLSALDTIGPRLTNLSIWASGRITSFGSHSSNHILRQTAEQTQNVLFLALNACVSIIGQSEFEKLGLDRTSHWLNLDTLTVVNIMGQHLNVKILFTTFPSLNRFTVVYEEPLFTSFTCFRRFPVTGEIEQKKGLSPSVLKESIFAFPIGHVWKEHVWKATHNTV